MEQIIIDTNILLRYILRDVESQYQVAQKFFIQAKKKNARLIVPQIVIFEIVFNLLKFYNFDKNKIVKTIKDLLSTNYLDIEDWDVFREALSIYEDNSVDFVDCFIIAKSQILGAKIFSFDKDFKKLTKTKT